MTWRLETEADLQALIDSGDAVESHVMDFKREIGTSDRARKEAAADMASFAVHGGSLVVGVAEPEKDKFSLMPFDTTGMVERIEQIAANRIRVPLYVSPRAIQSGIHPGLGYVVVEIPPSPHAPHQVDGRFYGRGEKTKRVLDVAEVERLLVGRGNVEARIEAALQEERFREPKNAHLPLSRLFLVAEPLAAPHDAARDFVNGEPIQVFTFVRSAEDSLPKSVRESQPGPRRATDVQRRSKGIAVSNLAAGRTVEYLRDKDRALDIEIQMSGSIRMLIGDVVRQRQVQQFDEPAEPQSLIMDRVMIGWTHRLVRFAEALSVRIGYRGPWGFGVHVYGLRGLQSVFAAEDGDQLSTFDAEEYERVTTASMEEIAEHRTAVVQRIIGDLALALESAEAYRDALTESE